MNEKKKYKQGEIYLVKFHPASGKELHKFRPAVIIFDSTHPGFVTISPLTSILKIRTPKLEFRITPSNTNNLEQDSLLLTWYMRTIDTNLIQKYLGKLSTSDQTLLKKSLKSLIN